MSQWYDVKSSVLYENRYCDQNEFDIIINYDGNGSKDSTSTVINMQSADANFKVNLIPIVEPRFEAKTAVVGSNLFFLCRSDKKVKKTSCLDVKSRSTWKY